MIAKELTLHELVKSYTIEHSWGLGKLSTVILGIFKWKLSNLLDPLSLILEILEILF